MRSIRIELVVVWWSTRWAHERRMSSIAPEVRGE